MIKFINILVVFVFSFSFSKSPIQILFWIPLFQYVIVLYPFLGILIPNNECRQLRYCINESIASLESLLYNPYISDLLKNKINIIFLLLQKYYIYLDFQNKIRTNINYLLFMYSAAKLYASFNSLSVSFILPSFTAICFAIAIHTSLSAMIEVNLYVLGLLIFAALATVLT